VQHVFHTCTFAGHNTLKGLVCDWFCRMTGTDQSRAALSKTQGF
jgi:hypothetical protein